MTPDEIKEVERLVNEAIFASYPIVAEEMSIDAAREKGAMALFGEKYGDIVRVVDMGGYSVELCGGAHLKIRHRLVPLKLFPKTALPQVSDVLKR